MRPIASAVLSIAAFAFFAAAQPSAPDTKWASVTRLAAGTEIRVFLAGGKQVRGFLQNATADGLALNATTSQERLARQEIKRVQLKRPGHRGRNTLIGFLIGAGTGLAAVAVADRGSQESWVIGRDAGKILLTPAGAIVGTVVGVALPTGGWHDVYRVP